MRKFYLPVLVFAFTLPQTGYAQKKITFGISAGSGLSWFSGKDTYRHTNYYQYYSNAELHDSVSNTYGNIPVAVTNFGITARIFLNRIGLGITIQHEFQGGAMIIDSIIIHSNRFQDGGRYLHRRQYLSFNPTIFFPLRLNKSEIIPQIGVDYAPDLEQSYMYKLKNSNYGTYGFSGGINEVKEIRITSGFSFVIERWLLNVVYKHGLTRYPNSKNNKAVLRVIQFNVLYNILDKKLK